MERPNEDLLLDDGLGEEAVAALPATRLMKLVSDAPNLAKKLLDGDVGDRADASIVFNSVAQIMARGLRDHDDELFSQGVSSLIQIWKNGDYKALYPNKPPDFEASLWENLGINLYALGGLAVYGERWSQVRLLTTQSPTGGSREKSWLRQGQVVSARSSADYSAESILGLAKRRLQSIDPSISDEAANCCLARFDLVSGLLIGEEDLDGFYPNAAEFSEALVEPLVIEELRIAESELRQQVFQGNIDGLVEALAEYDRKARLHAALARRRGVEWKWRGFSDARTLVFLAEKHILEEWEIPRRKRRQSD